ncbi:MAG TPA: TSUP family transporter [Clostridia bacterium]|nr:TSUP family transporter [Clostridia bacterium]
MKTLLGGLAIGSAAGILAGMVGVGGGIIIVPALVYFFGMDQKMAQGTSLAVLLPPTGLLAFMQYYRAGNVDLKVASLIVVGLLLGGWFGGGWAQQLSGPVLRKGFAVMMMLAAVKMFFQK